MSDDFDFLDAVRTKDAVPDGDAWPDASTDPAQSAPADAGPRARRDPQEVEAEGDAGPGAAGGLADAAPPSDAAAAPDGGGPLDPTARALHDALVHRWRFDVGAPTVDSIGGATAVAKAGATFSSGAAVFAGAGQYVDLPNDVLAGMRSASVEAWVIWDVTDPLASTSDWQRIFDLGSNSSTIEDVQASSANGIYLSPKSGGAQGKLHFEYRNSGNANLDAPSALPTGVLAQVVAVVDHESNLLSLYKDGSLVGSLSGASLDPPVTLDLSTVVYRNNWLGRSQYTDPAFKGRIFDFRIYSAALGSALIHASYVAGADADW